MIETPDGRWTAAAIRQRARLVAVAKWFNVPGRAWTLGAGNVVLATIRRTGAAAHQLWILRLHGHEFRVTADMPSARIWPVGGYISIKGYRTSAAAKKEAERLLKSMSEIGEMAA